MVWVNECYIVFCCCYCYGNVRVFVCSQTWLLQILMVSQKVVEIAYYLKLQNLVLNGGDVKIGHK